MEAIILAGGKAERLGDAARGRPKPLVEVGGRPIAAYQLLQLAAAGVTRVIVSCSAGSEELFERELAGVGPDLEIAAEPEPLGRGGGLRFAAALRQESGPVFALNGDELIDLDFAALLRRHQEGRPAATITVVPLESSVGVVDVSGEDVVLGFREKPKLPYWVSCGIYVLDDEALDRLPERGDHESTTFPELAAGERLHAYRHDGTWITVNTPKDLRLAEEFVAANPGWPN
jgi:NDP-sugar pyrophosphorylase family protein